MQTVALIGRITDKFISLIQEWLTDDELAKVDELNKTPEYKSPKSCATNLYCNPREAMEIAYEQCSGREWTPGMVSEIAQDAWILAKKKGFSKPNKKQ